MSLPPDPAATLDEARAALAAGDTPRALALAEAAWEAGGGWSAGVLKVLLLFRSGALPRVIDEGTALLAHAGDMADSDRFDVLRPMINAAIELGRFEVALPWAQQALACVEDGHDQGRLALGLNALACCIERIGDPWQSERVMEEALRAARQSRQTHPVLITLNNLVAVQIGMFHLMRDVAPPDQARAPLERALPLASEAIALAGQGDPFLRCFLHGNLGEVLLHLGRLEQADVTLGESLALARRIGAQAQALRMEGTRAELELARGHPEAAWARLQEVLPEARRSDVHMTRLRMHHTAWRCARARGDTAQALEHLEHYLQLERERALTQLRAQSELFVTRAEADRARRESLRDQLTQLGNRREAELRWPQLLAQAEQLDTPLSVAMLDLDHFKRINDVFGHAVGDEVLVTLAQLLRENTRQADLVARIGGEEFLLVMPEAGLERAREVCERLRQRVADWDWERLAPGLQVTLSAGVTAAPPFDAAVLTARADTALYRAKDEGRDRVVVLR